MTREIDLHQIITDSIKQPQNYNDLIAKAKAQLTFRIWELEQRAGNLAAFLRDLDGATADLDAIKALADKYDVSDYEDDLVPAMQQIHAAWPSVATAPGEGYWQ